MTFSVGSLPTENVIDNDGRANASIVCCVLDADPTFSHEKEEIS